MTNSVFISAENPAAAIQQVEIKFPTVLLQAPIQRVVEADGLIMDWATGELELIRDSKPI